MFMIFFLRKMQIPPGFIALAWVADDWRLSEIICHREAHYFVHVIGQDNAVGDEWVPEDLVKTAEPAELGRLCKIAGFAGSSFLTLLTVRKPHRQVKTVGYVELGVRAKLKAWYPSPYPLKFQAPAHPTLLVCESCLSFFTDRDDRALHWRRCMQRHPPGAEIYRGDGVSLFEVSGLEFPGYCERLVLFSKLFLEEKRTADRLTSQFSQVKAFTFFVLIRWAESGAELLGYFSRLHSHVQTSNVLSCILVLPHVQRKGYGKFLINAAYELAARERRRGTAERPLSALGKASFYSFWASKVLDEVRASDSVRLMDISLRTGITCEDIAECLKDAGVLTEFGKSVILLTNGEAIDALRRKAGGRGFPFDPERLHWTPEIIFEGEPTYSIQDQLSTPRKSVTTTTGYSDSPV